MINMTLKEFLKKELDDEYFTLYTKLKFVDEFNTGIRGFITLYDAIVEAGNNSQLWDKDIIVPLIDEIDNKYFQSILKPFINKYLKIKLVKQKGLRGYFIEFILYKENDIDYIELPFYPFNSSMFKDLPPEVPFTTEELGITRINHDGIREFI